MLLALPAGHTCASRAQRPESNPSRCVALGCRSKGGSRCGVRGRWHRAVRSGDQAVRAGSRQGLVSSSSRRRGGAGDRADVEALGASRSLLAGTAPGAEGMNVFCFIVLAFI
jgi:hypothetical protein